MQTAHQDAQKHLKRVAEHQKNYFDAKYTPHPYQTGEFVWRYVAKPARRKLTKGWVGPYRIVSIPNEQHCFLQKAPGQDPIRVHCDQLKPYLGKNPRGWGHELESAATPDASSESSGDGEEEEEDDLNEPPPDSEQESEGRSGKEELEDEQADLLNEEREDIPESPELGRGRCHKKPPDRYDWWLWHDCHSLRHSLLIVPFSVLQPWSSGEFDMYLNNFLSSSKNTPVLILCLFPVIKQFTGVF